jgi:AP-1 complex subunit beta-1
VTAHQTNDACGAAGVQVFFCKYNDPIYVKMEKLEIMIKLANEKNIDQVLLEFKEYAQEVDVDFVRKVRAPVGAVLRVWSWGV